MEHRFETYIRMHLLEHTERVKDIQDLLRVWSDHIASVKGGKSRINESLQAMMGGIIQFCKAEGLIYSLHPSSDDVNPVFKFCRREEPPPAYSIKSTAALTCFGRSQDPLLGDCNDVDEAALCAGLDGERQSPFG
jgi:hypothetical protein